jgi:hypothetical protein
MSFNPNLTTAENHALILAAHNQRMEPMDALISATLVSIPNGKTYGEIGHIPCDHSAVFLYTSGEKKIFDKNGNFRRVH